MAEWKCVSKDLWTDFLQFRPMWWEAWPWGDKGPRLPGSGVWSPSLRAQPCPGSREVLGLQELPGHVWMGESGSSPPSSWGGAACSAGHRCLEDGSSGHLCQRCNCYGLWATSLHPRSDVSNNTTYRQPMTMLWRWRRKHPECTKRLGKRSHTHTQKERGQDRFKV